jgi:phosphatidylserine/phosphatidylglycerophosphate/cardiolipin synthase-like enzyme
LIQIRTLTDGGQSAREIALLLASFLERAEQTLAIALYDVKLEDDTEAIVRKALVDAHERGVHVRLLYNLEPTLDDRVPVPPPPKTDPPLVEELPFETVGIPGVPDLMHHKYVVRDGRTTWTGSTNWTDDSWTREENVIVVVDSRGVAIRYEQDFGQLWNTRDVEKSGRVASDAIDVGSVPVRTWFLPKRGEKLAHRIAHAIATAERRVRIASPVITSGPVLGTLAEVVTDGHVDVAGVVDNTQVNEVLRQWAQIPEKTWKAPALRTVLEHGGFTGKRSTPYAPDAVHDYMHAKVTVCDDTLFVGSFNLSHSGEQNAENVLELEDTGLAEKLARFVDEIRARYPAVELDSPVRVA